MKGKVIIISGPSGVGKGTVSKRLLERVPSLFFSVSSTTRQKRNGEENGVHYFFLDTEEFVNKENNGEFLETTSRYGNRYGTDKRVVEGMLAEGKNVLLDIDVAGAMNVKKIFDDSISIFLAPPSLSDLFERIENRGTETPEQLQTRKESAEDEMQYMNEYDYVVVNDNLDTCVEKVVDIVLMKLAQN